MKNTSKTRKQPGEEPGSRHQRVSELEKSKAKHREAKDLYTTLANRSPVGVYIIQDRRFVFVNPEFQKYTSFTENELLGTDPLSLIHPEDRELVRQNAVAMLRGNHASPYEFRVICRNGEWIWAMETVTSIHYKGKRAALGNFMNITERKQTSEALKESEEFSSSLLSSSPNPILVFNSDTSIKYVNPALETLTGFTSAERIGRTVPYPWWTEEELERTREDLEETMRRGVKRLEKLFQKRNGERFWVEITSTSARRNGEVMYFLVSWIDFTERKRVEERLLRAAEEWRVTFDSITDFVSIHDKDFRLTRVNKAFADACNMKPKELIGKHCYEVMHGTNEPIAVCPLKQTILTKKPATADCFEPRLGVHLEITVSPIFNNEGHVETAVHIARDITKRKQMEAQLIVADRLASIGELASGIAHELNNPLTSVIGFSQLLLEQDMPEDIKEDIETVYREAQRAAEVVKNLLTFARKHSPVKQPVNINEVIENTLKLRAYEQKVNNIRVNTRLAPDLPKVMADNFQLQQAFLNITINAEHFMIQAHNSGTLTITTRRAGDVVITSFADDGPGIAPENLGHLFDPFFTTREVGQGTGLGLSICHGIMTEHGGRIYAESEPGKGATFVVELPVAGNDNKGGD